MQEVSTINLLQLVNPQLQAILVRFSRRQSNSSDRVVEGQDSSSGGRSGSSSMRWDTTSFQGDAARVEYHARKMKSKDERPASQMKVLGIASGTAIHLTVGTE